jgi:hypothetical protein
MTHTTSRIPAATDALIAAVTPALGTTNVVDGPPITWDGITLASNAVSETRFLFVGARPDEDVAVDGTQDFNAAGAVSHDERFNIYCTAYVWSGEIKAKPLRDDTFAIAAAVDQAIRADPTLADAVLYSRFAGVLSYAPRQTEGGADATVVFAVACRAYLE